MGKNEMREKKRRSFNNSVAINPNRKLNPPFMTASRQKYSS